MFENVMLQTLSMFQHSYCDHQLLVKKETKHKVNKSEDRLD